LRKIIRGSGAWPALFRKVFGGAGILPVRAPRLKACATGLFMILREKYRRAVPALHLFALMARQGLAAPTPFPSGSLGTRRTAAVTIIYPFFLVPSAPLWLKLSTMPPEKLFIYIYEIEGRVDPPDNLTAEDFLGCWREGDYSYLFFGRPMEERVKAWVATLPGARYSSETELSYADWEAGQPLQMTSMAGFHLCPVWETPAPGPGEVVIRMEPGLAFGSGYHPTTRRCLELLRRVYEADAPRQVLDLGTGTGILALASLALGAERVVAVEYNELAVRTAARNFKHNQRQGQVHLIQADARHFAHLPAGLALANIHLDVLLDLLDLPAFLDKDWYIFSGIRGIQLEVFLARLTATPLTAVATLDENMWFTVLARGARRSRI